MASKKAQAAIEYMMTHGWAILVLTAAIILLYSSGMFNPSKYIRQECYFQPDLDCKSFRLAKGESPAYSLFFSVNNGLGFDIAVDQINITTVDLGKKGEYTYTSSCSSGICSPTSGFAKSSGLLNVTFPINVEPTLARGALEQMRVSITYRNCKTDPGYRGTPETCTNGSLHIVSGRITANIE